MKRSTALLVGALLTATAVAGCSDSKSTGSSSAAYCAKIKAYKDKSNELDSVFTDTPDPKEVEMAFTTMQGMVNDLNSNAPAEIKADVATMSAAIDSVVQIFAKYDWDLMKLAAAPEMATLQEDFAGADMEAASARLETYSSTTCGIPSETSAT